MEQIFNKISESLFTQIQNGENLILSFSGENSQFIRFNKAAVRQTGLVDDADLGLKFIANNRTVRGGFTVSGNFDVDIARGKSEIKRMRLEAQEIPEDPFVVLPENSGSSHEIKSANGLQFEHAVDAILPAMDGMDFVGIWANGKMFRGNANNLGQKHWFETESFSLDYSLVTPEHQMVKGSFAGSDWNQNDYESYVKRSRNKLTLMEKKPIKIEKGNYRTWFESAAVSDFLGMFSWNGISEASLRQGCSGFGRMRHDDVRLSPKFSVIEDFSPGFCPKFNSNGEVSNDQLTLIDSGELKNTLVSSRSAKEYGVDSNYAEAGEYMRSPKMVSGELSQNDVVTKIGTGLYLSNIHYLNWSDNAGGRITGLTRYACFWVENGEIIAPIETMRFDDSFYNFFGDNLVDVEDKSSINPEVETYGGRGLGATTCPGILVNDFALTL
ncbi:MAG: TldD/PmbA family protein [Candidatus Marinimicrobia bacterium]|nr:TldD/PmbA family protein [Candidatus Neomarinimicrobiota bacterium]MBT4154241.1 TldD/PmbA family protein [Candidatus Neomarinimicrobiota bacterium]MBT4555895.1 TldD/PmbA family protein [Candidatus Neomarinimicrobiota bacterium]MBT5115517.1 TldD/PmbA family protein [Candidatus Neomarinimicrobiota bacterium]MBT5749024.1 TldD/PmbA family protein [Candidatus Neomarinimicrobiota bacterium]